ncbi:hypothetical protein [Streptomyces sp. WMMC940]|nr:hypothetical protein [Streptomyces sp. WMMC940]MCZ7461235.1 hypothetical protein [Streptomyces sp. WMMC940]
MPEEDSSSHLTENATHSDRAATGLLISTRIRSWCTAPSGYVGST